MRSNHLLTFAALVSLVALIGCDKARPLPAPVDPTRGCLSCHGGEENSTGAPPFSLPRDAVGNIVASGTRYTKADNTTQIEVGAHTRHIASRIPSLVSCGACHVVPAMINSPGHNTGKRAIVTFKELAAAGNVIPSAWVPAVHTCTNYCHGSSLGHGGTNHTPDWLGGAADGACGTCHFGAGVTPPAQHPQGPGGAGYTDTRACAACHTETVNAADGTINVTGGKHVNGQLDGGGGHSPGWADPANHGPAATGGLQGCTVCHGTDFNGGSTGVSCNACHSANGHPNWQTECTFCHGSTTRAADATFPNVGTGTVVRANLAAPPVGSQGENAITAYAVGAHDAHLTVGPFARAAQCFDCHGPSLPADTTHVNGTVVVGWGATASKGIVPTPAAGNLVRWNDATLPANGANCTNFCHGATLAGGTHTSPKWNEGATGAACGSCHAIPLPYSAAGGWHVQRTDCNTCHPGYTSASVNVADHVFVGAGPQGLTCTSCHGGANPAPPTDTTGASTGVKVGAHQKHLATTLTAATLGCDECHPTVSNPRHANGTVNISWNLGATVWPGATFPAVTPAAGPLPASWETTPTCANYCHGGFTNGKAATVSWSSTTAMTCNSCHGAGTGATATLPGGTHPQGNTDCSACHTGYTTTAVNAAVHLDGKYDVSAASCTACHGAKGAYTAIPGADALAAVAPPTDNTGATTGVKVGAHQAHVNQATYRTNPLACSACHPIPNTHNGTRDAAWSALATNTIINGTPVTMAPTPAAATGFTTAWEGTPTCTNACHGGNIPSNSARPAPSWTAIGGLTCTSCHGAPPPLSATANQSHPQNTACANCHGAGYGATAVNKATHMDGTLDRTTAGCTACHGDRSDTAVTLTTNTGKAAPGFTGAATDADTTGATTGTAVGAHRAHLVGAGGTPRWRSTAIACTECHALPASNADTTHATGVGTGGARATLAFGALAGDTAFETKTPAYAQPTCSGVYCHDPKSTDTAAGQVNAPAWNGATTLAQCGSCHGLPPTTAAHPVDPLCGNCHLGYANSPTTASTIAQVNALAHINGQLDGGGDCVSCHTGTQPMAAGGTRRAIVPEFAQAWSHKRSAGGAVTKWDCVVCHMEGDAATGNPSAVHKDGVINLRDPDTGANIKGVTFGGTGAGAYTPTATDLTFVEFSRNLGSATLEPAVQAIMINQCLKCHDSNGALSPLARVPTTGTAEKPFGTTISGAGYVAGGDVSASNVAGGVVNVNQSFKTTNSSYHPVTGKQNNWYAKLTRMVAPWNAATRGASVDVTSWGPLLSCWDCHSDPADTGIITRTVTAHGGANSLRGTATVSGTPSAANQVTLCAKCHSGYLGNGLDNHGSGSAFTNGTDGGMTAYVNYGCNICHSSGYTTAVVRPVRAQDTHGVNVLPTGGITKSLRWAVAGAVPIAFIRNTQVLPNHSPKSIGATAYTPNCMGGTVSPCSQSSKSYSPGGTF